MIYCHRSLAEHCLCVDSVTIPHADFKPYVFRSMMPRHNLLEAPANGTVSTFSAVPPRVHPAIL